MNETGLSRETAIRLAELTARIHEIEAGRLSLIRRFDEVRSELQKSQERASTLKASLQMLREHLATSAAAAAELRALEDEIQSMGVSVVRLDSDSLGLLFEADSLRQLIGEAEDEMERLLTALIEGKTKLPRGH